MRIFGLYGSIRLTVARLDRTVSDVELVLSIVEADIGVHVDACIVDVGPVNVWRFCLDIFADLVIVFDDLVVDDTGSVDVVGFVSSDVDDIGIATGLVGCVNVRFGGCVGGSVGGGIGRGIGKGVPFDIGYCTAVD